MYAKILIAVIVFPLLGSFAQAGVITGIDWDQMSMSASVQSEQSPGDEPIHFERVDQSGNGMSATSGSVFFFSISGILATMGQLAPANVTGTILDSDLAPPVPPYLDGIIRPA